MSVGSERRWYVVYTKPAKEAYAIMHLGRKRIRVFCPWIREHYWKKGRVEKRLRPLFPGYIFVHIVLDEEYYKVKWTPGVKRLISFGGRPIPLKDEIVDFMKGVVNREGVVSREKLKKGCKVRVKSGPFKDLIGIIENEVSPAGRVKILMELVNYSARVELPEVLLEAVKD